MNGGRRGRLVRGEETCGSFPTSPPGRPHLGTSACLGAWGKKGRWSHGATRSMGFLVSPLPLLSLLLQKLTLASRSKTKDTYSVLKNSCSESREERPQHSPVETTGLGGRMLTLNQAPTYEPRPQDNLTYPLTSDLGLALDMRGEHHVCLCNIEVQVTASSLRDYSGDTVQVRWGRVEMGNRPSAPESHSDQA